MNKPLREVILGSLSLLKIAEKPLGIGLVIGLVGGFTNSYILGISLWISLVIGSILGIVVCLIGSPAMKSELKARRIAEADRRNAMIKKARVASAFTAFE